MKQVVLQGVLGNKPIAITLITLCKNIGTHLPSPYTIQSSDQLQTKFGLSVFSTVMNWIYHSL